jgi:hypothetical protein
MKSGITFRNAYYIKLGRGGSWEEDSISKSLMRIGWSKYSIEDINAGRWSEIEKQLQIEHAGKPQVATTDFNRLRDIALSTPDDIWITFHGAKMWWGKLAAGRVESDQISKFRRIEDKWSLPNCRAKLPNYKDSVERFVESRSPNCFAEFWQVIVVLWLLKSLRTASVWLPLQKRR